MLQLRKMSLSALVAIAMTIGSVPIAYSAEYLGTFQSLAACKSRGKELMRMGEISSYRCVSMGSYWKLRSGSDNNQSLGKLKSKTVCRGYRCGDGVPRLKRRITNERHNSMAACRARGRALVRTGSITSYQCRPSR